MQYLYRQFTLLFHIKLHRAFLILLIKSACKSKIIAPREYIICCRLFEGGSFILTPLTGAYTYTPFRKRQHKHILLKQNRIHWESWTRAAGTLRALWVLGPRVWYTSQGYATIHHRMNLGFSFYTGSPSLSQDPRLGQLGLWQALTVMQHSKHIPTFIWPKRVRILLHLLSTILWTFWQLKGHVSVSLVHPTSFELST